MTVPFVLRRPSGLRGNLLASVGGNTVFALGGWLTLVFLTKLTDAATVGRYVLALALTAPPFLFANLQLREVQATDPVDGLPFAAYFRARVLTTSLALVAIGGLAFLYDGATRTVILFTALGKALDAVVDVVYGDWLRAERQGLVAASLALRGLTTALFVGLALVLTRSLVVASTVSALQSGLGLAHALWIRKEPLASLRGWMRTPAPALRLLPLVPLGLAVAFDSLAVNIPRYVVERYDGLAAVGVFGAVGALMQLGGATVVVALTQIGVPRLSRRYAAGDAWGYARLLRRLLATGIALGALGLLVSFLFGGKLLAAALGPSYAPHTALLDWTMLNALVWYVGGILACGVTATRNFRVQFPIFGAAMVAVSTAAFLLVPRYGLEGAGASVLVGFLVRAMANGLIVRRALRSL